MRTIFSKTSKTKFMTIAACALAAMISLFGVSAVFANEGGGAGTGSDHGGGIHNEGCSAFLQGYVAAHGYNSLSWSDNCGGGFKLYDVNDSASWPNIGDANYISNNIVPVCKELGGSFYMLALHYVTLYSPGGSVVYTGRFAQRRQVKQLKPGGIYEGAQGGSNNTAYIAQGGAEEFSKVLQNYKDAVAYANKRIEEDSSVYSKFSSLLETSWPDINWFCWQPGGYETSDTSGFSSKSKVSSGSKTSESPSWGQDATTLEVSADDDGKAEVKFSHKLQYTNPSASGNYNDAYVTWVIKVDGVEKATKMYFTPGSMNKETDWLPETGEISTTVTLGSEKEKTVCSRIDYNKTIEWDDNDPKNATSVPPEVGTQACVKVTASTTSPAGYVEFWSRSHVSSVAMNDVPYLKASTYDNINGSPKYDGDEVEMNISTDYSEARANFSHDLNYVITLNSGNTYDSSNDTFNFDNMCTKWTIQSNYTSSNGKNGTYCANAYSTGNKTDVSTTTDHIVSGISAANGSEFPASEKITFTKKKIPIYREEIKTNKCNTNPETNNCSYDPKHWKYYANANTGSGEGSSKATIIYEPPPVPGGEGPSSGSQTNSNPFYAGETGRMSWNTDVWPTKTRRVGEYQTVAFVSQVSRALGDGSSTHQSTSSHSSSDPCAFWSNQLSPLRDPGGGDCKQVTVASRLQGNFGNGAMFNSTSRDYDHTTVSFSVNNASMAIPDWVGDKYCTSIGYRWHYWTRIFNKEPKPGKWEWIEYGTPYWTHYSAACRTIAKKPSVAFWNGGLFVGQGDVRTIISSRRQNPGVAVPAASLDPRQYGSWSEYLANVNGEVAGGVLAGAVPGAGGLLFSSGATYAWNGADNGNTALKNSPLTIQNADTNSPLGYSGVSANSAVLERLEAYFKKAAELKPGGCSVLNGESDINETKICYTNDDVAIAGNITLDAGTKNSIYQIPQVVIFTTGSINISEKVTQIDAWLISKGGKVDTCTNGSSSVFKSGETQARVDKSSNPINAPGYNTCQDKLIINGPVFAQSVTTKRSFGSDGVANTDSDPANAADTRAVPAEVFNLSAASYLWAYAQAGRYGSSYTEAYSRELPPRY